MYLIRVVINKCNAQKKSYGAPIAYSINFSRLHKGRSGSKRASFSTSIDKESQLIKTRFDRTSGLFEVTRLVPSTSSASGKSSRAPFNSNCPQFQEILVPFKFELSRFDHILKPSSLSCTSIATLRKPMNLRHILNYQKRCLQRESEFRCDVSTPGGNCLFIASRILSLQGAEAKTRCRQSLYAPTVRGNISFIHGTILNRNET